MIVSSVLLSITAQSDGTVDVSERHTDDDGAEHVFVYRVQRGAVDPARVMADRAVRLGTILGEAKAERARQELIEAGDTKLAALDGTELKGLGLTDAEVAARTPAERS